MTHEFTDQIVGIVVVGSRLCKSDRFRYKRSLNGEPKQQKKPESESGVPEFRSLLTKCPPLKKFNSGMLTENGLSTIYASRILKDSLQTPKLGVPTL